MNSEIAFVNGKINTFDDAGTMCTAVAANNGIISALGTDAEIKDQMSGKAEIVDLKGAVMFPGFMEVHNHLPMYGYLTEGINLAPPAAVKMGDVLELVKKQVDSTPAGTWIKASRYAEYYLAENRHPTRRDLDQVSPEHPVIIFHISLHACVLNSLALKQMGITKETPTPQGGIIEKEPDTGEPSGVLHDQAMMDVFNKMFFNDIGAMSQENRIEFCRQTCEEFAKYGLVFAADALTVPQTLSMYQDALAADKLKIRIYTMNYALFADTLTGAMIKTGFGSPMLRIGPIKIFADGGMSNRTAAVSEPFLTPPYGTGLKIQSREELIEKVKWYHTLGNQIAIHAQGDAGISDTLDAYEAVLGSQSDNPLRHRIEHGGCLYPDLLKRAAAMNIHVSVQPTFLGELGDGFIEAFGPEKAALLYPFKSMLDIGMHIGGSSDSPVALLDPRLGLRDAVTRKSSSGEVLGPNQALTMDQALRVYTREAAYLSFDENNCGIIEPGKRADFTVMDADPREVPPEEVPDIPFSMTVVGGEIVWSA